MSIGSLYQYFSNKDELVLAIINRHAEGILDLLRKTVVDLSEVSIALAVRDFVGAMMARLPGSPCPSLAELRDAAALGTVAASFTISDFATTALHQAGEDGIRQRLSEFRDMCTFS